MVERRPKEKPATTISEAFKIAAHSSARRSSQRSTHLDASESELELTGPAVRTFRIRQFSPATRAEENQDSYCSRAKSIRQRAPSGCMNSSKTCILPTRTQGLTPTHLAFDDKVCPFLFLPKVAEFSQIGNFTSINYMVDPIIAKLVATLPYFLLRSGAVNNQPL